MTHFYAGMKETGWMIANHRIKPIKAPHARILEHMRKSYRTGVQLSSPLPTAIREHCYSTEQPLSQNGFQILTSASHSQLYHLRIIYFKDEASGQPFNNCHLHYILNDSRFSL